ncbi:recombinase family protein [Nocardia sp. NPDC046763]|uniref:recombinase family protein n=1 Tax=Nocardia sp. NPDC046763 TaxID=3155256 RepID=UPI0033F42DC0
MTCCSGSASSIYDWPDPFGTLFLRTLAMVAEFEANLNHLRTREGMAKARAKGRLEGKQPKLPLAARKTIHRRYRDPNDDASPADLADEYSVSRSTIHRIIGGDTPRAQSHSGGSFRNGGSAEALPGWPIS